MQDEILELNQLAFHLSRHTGLRFSGNRRQELTSGLLNALQELKCKNTGELVARLSQESLAENDIMILASHLAVGETYFFREPTVYQALETQVIPELLRHTVDGRSMRIWSAGCSSGEEAYSIAILMRQLVPNLTNRSVTISGTDINPHALQKAREGIYTDWSFRGVEDSTRQSCFRKIDAKRYQVNSEIRSLVNFDYVNLATDSYPSVTGGTAQMDLILCRNTLMYFSAEVAGKVFRRLFGCLNEGGWLIVSPTDVVSELPSGCQRVQFERFIVYRKQQGSVAAQQATSKHSATRLKLPISVDHHAVLSASDIQALYLSAKTFYRQGNYRAAADLLQPVVRQLSKDMAAVMLLINALLNQNELTQALEVCDLAIRVNRLAPELYYLKALVFHEQGNTEEAIRSLKKTIFLDPVNALAHCTMRDILSTLGRVDESSRTSDQLREILDDISDEKKFQMIGDITAGDLRSMIGSTIADNLNEQQDTRPS